MAKDIYLRDATRVIVAQVAGDTPAMDETARNVLHAVKQVALPHMKTGHYIRSLTIMTVKGERGTGKTVNDRVIVATDPGAAAIEWGHYVIRKVPGGRRVQGRFVPGQHIMGRAIGLTKVL